MSASTCKTDSGRDYRNTDTTPLSFSPFPVQVPVELRVYFEETAHVAMKTHACTATNVELGGVLVGEARKDAIGPYVFVAGSIPAEGARNNGAQITFTHEVWSYIHEQCDTQYPKYSIVGWYHTHPGFGIFLSDMDRFIHDSFFDQPFHIAVVIDPTANQEGCFVWQEGSPAPISRYWSGEQVVRLAGATTVAKDTNAGTYTSGVVSSTRKIEEGAITIDVYQIQNPVNPGNSGGGLYSDAGEQIGINTWKQSGASSEGIAFSISTKTLVGLLSADEAERFTGRTVGVSDVAIRDESAI